MLLLRLLPILLVALLVGCTIGTSPTETPPDSFALITEAADKIRSAQTFRIEVNETGPNYMIFTEYATVYFRRATAQYVAPDLMQAVIRVIAGGLPLEVEVFSRGAEQWYRAIWTGNNWVNQAFAPDFNPETLIADDTGFEAALNALIDLSYVGEEELENGTPVYHLAATANGPDVSALLGGLIQPVGIVNVDVFVERNTRYPVRFIITEHASPFAVTPEPGQESEPVVWTIDIYDLDAESALTPPELSAVTPETTSEASDSTPEATSESTPEARS